MMNTTNAMKLWLWRGLIEYKTPTTVSGGPTKPRDAAKPHTAMETHAKTPVITVVCPPSGFTSCGKKGAKGEIEAKRERSKRLGFCIANEQYHPARKHHTTCRPKDGCVPVQSMQDARRPTRRGASYRCNTTNRAESKFTFRLYHCTVQYDLMALFNRKVVLETSKQTTISP